MHTKRQKRYACNVCKSKIVYEDCNWQEKSVSEHTFFFEFELQHMNILPQKKVKLLPREDSFPIAKKNIQL